MSIDVEGHELEVLQGFDLKKTRPDLVLIEDKFQNLSKHKIMKSYGYRLVRRTCLNNWYIPYENNPPARELSEVIKLYRKVYLGLPFRKLRHWRHARKSKEH